MSIQEGNETTKGREADLYTGQKTARGNSQPGAFPGRYDN